MRSHSADRARSRARPGGLFADSIGRYLDHNCVVMTLLDGEVLFEHAGDDGSRGLPDKSADR